MEYIKLLSRKEYLATMSGKMRDITETAEPLIDVWKFVGNLPDTVTLSEYGVQKRLVEAVYENEGGTYHHVLLFGEKNNSYVVIIIDVIRQSIFGCYQLDLDKEYHISEEDE